MGIALCDPQVDVIMDDVFEALHAGRDVGTALFALVIGFMFQNRLGLLGRFHRATAGAAGFRRRCVGAHFQPAVISDGLR